MPADETFFFFTPISCLIAPEKSRFMGTCFFLFFFLFTLVSWNVAGKKMGQLMNLTPSVKKDKIFVFFCVCDVEWCMIISTFFYTSRGKGCKHIKHDLLWIQPHIQSTFSAFQADVRLHDILYFICFAF